MRIPAERLELDFERIEILIIFFLNVPETGLSWGKKVMILVTWRPWYKKYWNNTLEGKKSHDLNSKVYKMGGKENRKTSKQITKCKD